MQWLNLYRGFSTSRKKQRRITYLLIAFTKSLKWLNVKRGSGNSRKNILSAPVMTWISSHLLSFKSSFSSEKRQEEEIFKNYFKQILTVMSDYLDITIGNIILPWLTANLSFWITARLPLTLYIPSTSKPRRQIILYV